MVLHHQCAKSLQLYLTLCIVMYYSSPVSSMGFSGQEYQSGLPSPPPGDLLNPGTEPTPPIAPALQVASSLLSRLGGPVSHWHLQPSMAFSRSSVDKESACNAGDQGSIPGSGRSLEKEMATHSSILAWRIPWIEEPGGLQSTGLQESDMTQ